MTDANYKTLIENLHGNDIKTYTQDAANQMATLLQSNDLDGWTYNVVDTTTPGRYRVEVRDEGGQFVEFVQF